MKRLALVLTLCAASCGPVYADSVDDAVEAAAQRTNQKLAAEIRALSPQSTVCLAAAIQELLLPPEHRTDAAKKCAAERDNP